MKKMFTFAAMACVALASCTKNESVEVPQQDVITFAEPVTAVNTKATEIIGNYPASKHFSVFAHYFTGDYTSLSDGQLYMNDVETAYSSAVDGWDSKAAGGVNYYWPKQGTLTFAAYSPSSVNASYDASGIHFANFTVPAAAADQYDLLFSERSYNQTKATMNMEDNPYKGVQIQFNHALSSIIFNAKTDINYSADKFLITINKVVVKNIYSTATFNQNLVDTNEARTSDTWQGWTDHSAPTDYTAFNGSQDLTDENAIVDKRNINPGTASDASDVYNSHLILLPQGLSNAKLYVEYTITNQNVTPNTVISQTATIDLSTNNVASWFRGKRYTYNLTFGLDKIYFDPVVTAWDSVTVTPDLNIGR